jgi:ribosomal protein S1
VGDPVTVTVIDINPDKNKISLTLKDINNNPWNNVAEKYPIGSLIEGKVVRMAAFGAFINLEDGVDGLVHVSQIADKHVAKPEDELSVNQVITVKVTDVDEDNKKISLSKKLADAELAGEYDDDEYDDYDDDYDYDDEHYDDDAAGGDPGKSADLKGESDKEQPVEESANEPKTQEKAN